MTLPPRLQKELDEVGKDHRVNVQEEGDWIDLVFVDFSLGDGFNRPSSNLLVRLPRSYPDAGPDMFWLDPAVTFSSGQIPQSAEVIEQHIGQPWRRFSWHRQAWNPSIDNLHGHLEFIRRRLKEKR